MENTLLIALSHQSALQRRMEVIANNLANMNSAGFKSQSMMFSPHVVHSEGGYERSGDDLAFVHDVAAIRDFSDGAFEKTGNPLDIAVRGDGWFTVETPDGERYTRNGAFRIDRDNRLVTGEGYPVLAEGNQPVIVDAGASALAVAGDGTISAGAQDLGRLRIVRFENPNLLRAVAGGLMVADEPATAMDYPEVVQGMIERSNVEPIVEITHLIDVHRAYQGAANLIEQEDKRIRTMVEEYAR